MKVRIPKFLVQYIKKKYPNRRVGDVVIAKTIAMLLIEDSKSFLDYLKKLEKEDIDLIRQTYFR